MNKQQLNDLQKSVEEVIKSKTNLYGVVMVTQFDVEAGFEIEFGYQRVNHQLLTEIQLLAIQNKCVVDIYVKDEGHGLEGLTLDVISTENGGLTDESMAKHKAYEAYKSAYDEYYEGEPLSFEEWIELPANKHLDV